MKRSLLIAVVAGVCVVGPAAAQAAPRSGVVVDYRAHSHTATVATKSGKLIAVHSRGAVRVGARVNVNSLRRLNNGTLAATLVRTGRARHARIRGVIVAKIGRHAIAIGTKGATFVVKTGHSRTHHSFSVSDPLTVGTTVMADVSINGSELDADDVTAIQGAQAGQTLELEGKVTNVDTTVRTLTITVSDDGVSAAFTVNVPDTAVDLNMFTPGSEVELNVTANGDGTFTLQAGDLNGDEQEADDDGGDDSGQGGGGGHGESAVHA